MSKKKKLKNEFRKKHDKKGQGHPGYIFEKVGDEFVFLGITHSSTSREVGGKTINIELEKNPNPKDKKKAYIKPAPEKSRTKNFGRELRDWKFSNADKVKVEKIKNSTNKKKSDRSRPKDTKVSRGKILFREKTPEA